MQPHLFNKIMHDVCNYDAYFVQKYDAIGVLGLLSEKKLTASLRMLAFGACADQMDEIARMGKSTILESLVRFCDAIETLYTRDLQRLLQKVEARGFPSMIGSIDWDIWLVFIAMVSRSFFSMSCLCAYSLSLAITSSLAFS
ncbi:unnamed protein product [Prunus brigantina]